MKGRSLTPRYHPTCWYIHQPLDLFYLLQANVYFDQIPARVYTNHSVSIIAAQKMSTIIQGCIMLFL
ncbi:hypothetical protein [Virgibacillus chiguensis]|uniref:hypothetical protein n=1 Tax=Virgibacillus chiguensis TaxID=411959 RepID=UPI001BAF4AAA|nr:hypothetical protein [Virgibacillus chiguensis]